MKWRKAWIGDRIVAQLDLPLAVDLQYSLVCASLTILKKWTWNHHFGIHLVEAKKQSVERSQNSFLGMLKTQQLFATLNFQNFFKC